MPPSPRRDHAVRLWSIGMRAEALESLHAQLKRSPRDTDLRRILVGWYRELGNPDQSGRWGIALPEGITAIEHDRLARLLAAS